MKVKLKGYVIQLEAITAISPVESVGPGCIFNVLIHGASRPMQFSYTRSEKEKADSDLAALIELWAQHGETIKTIE